MTLDLRGLHLLLCLDLRQRDLLRGADPHDELHVGREQLPDRLVQPPIGDRCGLAVRLLQHVLLDRAPRDSLREGWHPENPHLRVRWGTRFTVQGPRGSWPDLPAPVPRTGGGRGPPAPAATASPPRPTA